MALKSLDELAQKYKCVIYNDLSHISPYYLVPKSNIYQYDEEAFHKRNIYLLSLFFDKIIICTDNILTFTRFTTKDVVSHVVQSDWFTKLLDSGVIVLCGWGAEFNNDMMFNQIEYAKKYRSDLKESKYVNHLKGLSQSTDIIIREPSMGEVDHVLFLNKRLKYLEGLYTPDEIKYVSDIVNETQEEYGFVGTMEIFPYIDDLFVNDSQKMSLFYENYFQSWQEYCNSFYSPAVTVDSFRNRIPARTVILPNNNSELISSLYSPDFFYRFITARLGERKVQKILGVKPERLLKIRNGDWKVFVERYHKCLQAASEIGWIAANARKSSILSNQNEIDSIVDDIFRVMDKETDLSSIGSLLDTLLSLLIGVSFLGPFFRIFKSKINKQLTGFANSMAFKEFEPFLKKLSLMLADSSAIQKV